MHACGHDAHIAIGLTCAKLLSRAAAELCGTVKVIFQPAEEGEFGAQAVLETGLVNDVNAFFGVHVWSPYRSGELRVSERGVAASTDMFTIAIHGLGGHGAMPELCVDTVVCASELVCALQTIASRFTSPFDPVVVTVGSLHAGTRCNIIAGEAVLEGTIRTFDRELSARIMERIRVIAENTAAAFRGSAHLEEIASAPPRVNDPALMEQVAGWAEELAGKEKVYRLDQGGMGSEDFASFTYALPCAYLLLGAGTPQEDPRYGKPMHNEAVVFNEDVLPTGAALHTLFALRMLAQET